MAYSRTKNTLLHTKFVFCKFSQLANSKFCSNWENVGTISSQVYNYIVWNVQHDMQSLKTIMTFSIHRTKV